MVETKDREGQDVDTAEEREFRLRARKWLEENVPRRRERTDEDDEDLGPMGFADQDATDLVRRSQEFQRKLHEAGFAGITFPKEYGGQGLSQRHQRIFNEESGAFEMQGGVFGIGLGMCAPTILTHGDEHLKRRYLPKLLSGAEIWSQLFSEPGAGSDVASLQTRAVQSGDEWIMNGQKVWTSGAHYSDYGCIIARTDVDVPKHQGITMFIVHLKGPGVTVKPLRQMTGGASFNEVFFDDVRIPGDHVIGEVNKGWGVAITMLMNERVSIGTGNAGGRQADAGAPLVKEARAQGLNTDPVVRQRLMDLYVRSRILSFVGQRISAQVKAGITPGAEGSIAKLSGSINSELSANLGAALHGVRAAAWDAATKNGDRWAQGVLGYKGGSIAGGTSEIMRNIIGERVLGLPKEPQVDREQPFRDLKVGTQRPGE